MLATQMATEVNHSSISSPKKIERRESSTSESSLEHLDLGRTPKKLKIHSSATSTPQIVTNGYNSSESTNAEVTTNIISKVEATPESGQQKRRYTGRRNRETDESNDYDDDESADEKKNQPHRFQRHHKRRGAPRLDKRTSVQLEYNADNPNSLRKKFRFSRNNGCSDTIINNINDITQSTTNNESGFVDATNCSSQYLNSSNASTQKPHCSGSTVDPVVTNTIVPPHSSASSSPHGGDAGGASSVSSPESGIGEREDMKYVCPICEVVSASPHEFTNHIRCHNYNSGENLNFTCRICSKALSSASSLDRHVLVHTGERPFNCKYCHLTFTTNGNMHRHMRTHKEHQHTHHRRNSNGTKNNNNSAATVTTNNNNNKNNSTSSAVVALLGTGLNNTNSIAKANTNNNSTHAHAQLTNGNIIIEGVNQATTANLKTSKSSASKSETGAKSRRFNSITGGIESCESDGDGGCSTDSSSAISQCSNNHNNNNNNANNYNDDNTNNNNNNNSSNNNNLKHQSNSHHLDATAAGLNAVITASAVSGAAIDDDDITLTKRRVKTTINNNNIIVATTKSLSLNSAPMSTSVVSNDHPQPISSLSCPVCSLSDFENMLTLSAHIDSVHPDIPAKCRNCDVVFRTHRQLNVHPCTHSSITSPTYECSRERYPLIAKTLSSNSQADKEENGDGLKLNKYSPLQQNAKVLSAGECSAGEGDTGEEQEDDAINTDSEQQRRDTFFRHLYLQNKSFNSLVSPPLRISDEQMQNDHLDCIKSESESEKNAQHMVSQDSKDLADIQSILNMTSSSSTSNFLKNLEQSVHTPSSNCSIDKEEDEAQDAFRSEIRKMKLRGEFPCKLCKEKFRNLRALKGHIKEHSSPAGPFRCTVCSFTIIDKAAFRQHMLTHKGDRPYECVVCNFAFTTKANCERHIRNIHAMTTRDEVKRAIIYHPSEDSSCDDPSKKLHLFSSPEFDDDGDFPYQNQHPKDRSTPVSHLKEMLTSTSESPSTKPIKIQVKSLEQLIEKSNSTPPDAFNNSFDDTQANNTRVEMETAPIDLSMDVLDLSKKPQTVNTKPIDATAPCVPSEPGTGNPLLPQMDQFVQFAEKMKEQLLQMWKEPFPNFWLPLAPPINPFAPPNPPLANNLEEMQKLFPLLRRMFDEANLQPNLMPPNVEPAKPIPNNLPQPNIPQRTIVPQISPLHSEKHEPMNAPSTITPMNHLYPKALTATGPGNSPLSLHSRHAQMPPTMLPGGPVKMVIKNGVLMPKQKQRRYRTERPFACEHCSARFTLRSNMERHVKQQHPQFYAQRQRSGHHIMRGRGASGAATMNSFSHLQAAFAQAHNNGIHTGSMGGNSATISDQVKNAILAQHLKARKESDLLQQALAHGTSSIGSNHLLLDMDRNGLSPLPVGQQFSVGNVSGNHGNGCVEDDEPKLIIDEDEDEDMEDDEVEEIPIENEEETQDVEQKVIEEIPLQRTPLTAPPSIMEETPSTKTSTLNDAAKKVRDVVLEQTITTLHKNSVKPKDEIQPPAPATTMKSMIAQAESVGKFLKEVASSPFKDESQDLVSVSKLVDNATNNSVTFNNYFRPSDVTNHMEQSDEEGLVASGSASESNNSGTEDVVTNAEPKKKSAYSLAPNRVSCPYCQRMFPWSSSLRRHILTHTGQKPFKCSHCPLLFTTKSNCDRHLLRKHGNVESAMSVYMPTEDVTEPIPVPKSVEEIEQQQRQREEEERKRKAEEEKKARQQQERERQEREERHHHQQQQQKQDHEQQQQFLKQLVAAAQLSQSTVNNAPNINGSSSSSNSKIEQNSISSSELPFKCHLCESSFGERFQCLDHINNQHKQEFLLLLAKGAIEIGAEPGQSPSNDDEESRAPMGTEENVNGTRTGGRYPDYSNRKVICAFCVRRFWSTEDLRRHMRTHSGERPFQCDVCLRKFTLKHSMLRHMKKHNGHPLNVTSSGDLSAAGNSGSDFSDDEQPPTTLSASTTATSSSAATTTSNSTPNSMNSLGIRAPKIQELLNKANEWRTSRLGEQKENISEEHNQQTDLIGNLLGISDQGILNKLLTSADEAAKLLGVEK